METTKVLTSLLVLTLTGPSLGYPYTRGVLSRNSERAPRDRQFMDSGYSDYLDGYVQDEQYGLPEYQPAYRHEYVPQRQRISAEALAALLPYLTTSSNDYADDYNFYSDNDGTWYDDVANDDLESDTSDSDSAALLKFLIDHRNGRYSLEDLETLEREAEMEDNTENQLHALMAKKINKKSSMPLLGARQIAVAAPALVRKGQKEEALDVPSTSIRRPVFGRQINTEAEETEPQAKRNIAESSSSSSSSGIVSMSQQQQQPSAPAVEGAAAAAAAPVINANPAGSLAEDAAGVKDDSTRTTMTPFMQSKYEALMKYLDRERKVRQNQDIEQELQQETKSQPQKRFVSEQDDDLSRQLANLKKKVVA